jgi:Spy/CpxP family protein refolding chaperone
MKRVTLMLSAALFTAQLAIAQQPPPGPPPRGGPPVEMMARQLGLDDTQKTAVKRIFEEQRTRHETERKQYEATGQRPTPEEMKTMRAQHDQELVQALSSVLTPDQLTKFKTLEAQRGQHMRHGPPPPPPAAQ